VRRQARPAPAVASGFFQVMPGGPGPDADDINDRYRMRAAERERGVRPEGLLRITEIMSEATLPAPPSTCREAIK